MPVSPTAAPRGITAHWHTGHWIRLTWEPIRNPTRYEYEHEYSGGPMVVSEPRTDQFAVAPGATSWCRIRNVACGEPSPWVKVTVNDKGEITKREEEGNDPPPPPPSQPPKPPSGLRLVSADVPNGIATVVWDQADDADSWEVLLDNEYTQYQPADRPEFRFGNLVSGRTYGYRVRAINRHGTSAPTRSEFPFEGDTPPEEDVRPPRNLRISDVGTNRAQVQWDAPTGGTPVDHYHLSWAKANAGNTGNDTTTATHYQITGLDADSDYGVAVTSFSATGTASKPVTTQWHTKKDEKPPPPPPTGEYPKSAPFVDAMGWPTPRLRKWFKQWGVQGFFLGFWAAKEEADGYHLSWGGYGSAYDKYEPIGDDKTSNPSGGVTHSHLVTDSDYLKWLTSDIQQAGGTIIPSVGGANGHPLEQHPEVNLDQAAAEYIAALDNYNTAFLDFDIEGGALTQPEQIARHVEVLLKIRAKRPDIKISHTFAVDIDGYNHHTQALVEEMARRGYQPNMVMGMLMEMRVAADGSYYTSMVESAEAMVRYNAAQFGWTEVESWQRFGACPMFGVNNGVSADDRKVTTVAHMKRLVNEVAAPHQIATVSGWAAHRDYHAHNPDQKAEDTPKCPPGPPYPSIFNCTHVEQEHAQFSKLAATYR